MSNFKSRRSGKEGLHARIIPKGQKPLPPPNLSEHLCPHCNISEECDCYEEITEKSSESVLLCSACAHGRPNDCSGWCGIQPSSWVGPVQPWVWEDLIEIDCFVDPWEDSPENNS